MTWSNRRTADGTARSYGQSGGHLLAAWQPHAKSLVAVTSLACSVVACSERLSAPIVRDSSGSPVAGGVLRVATFVHLRSLDPAVAFDEVSVPIMRLVYEPLFEVSDRGNIVGVLVKEYHWEQGGRVLVAQLRHGVRMQDGDEVTAADVKRSLERTLHPKTPCPAPSFFNSLVGFEVYRDGKAKGLRGVRVTGRYSFEMTLAHPDAAFLPALTLSFASPVCKSAGRVYNPEFQRSPCGAGAYRVHVPYSRQKLTLERFDNYYRADKSFLAGIQWLFGVKTTSQRFRFERGDIDLVHELSASDSIAFRSDERWKPLGSWNYPRSTRGIFMNTELPPFDDVRMRRAVSFAIDRNAIASLRAGHLVRSQGMIPRGVVGFDGTFRAQHYDRTQALRLMREAGYPFDSTTGRGGYPRTIDFVVAANSFDQRIAEVYQQQLAAIGIRIRIRPLAWAAYLALSGRRRTTVMGADGWSADYDDPSDFLDPLFATSAIQQEDSQNRAFYSNPRLDRLLRRGRRTLEPNERQRIYRQAQAIVRDDAPWAVVYGYRYYDVWQPYVRGYRTHPHKFLDLAGVWLEPDMKKTERAARSAPPGSVLGLVARLLGNER